MQTNFTAEQLSDPEIRRSDRILRACVHCGFCLATCPTYRLNGNELDSPRGRIYLIKSLLEGAAVTPEVVGHIDSCLSCFSCMTTCPADVNYMHLVDLARHRIEENFRRPVRDRLPRAFLNAVLARPALFRACLRAAAVIRPMSRLLPKRIADMIGAAAAYRSSKPTMSPARCFPAHGQRLKRVALLAGCVQPVLAPQINEATVRLLTRLGCEVIVPPGSGCCGALARQLGQAGSERRRIIANLRAWSAEADGDGLDAVVVNASGCGTVVKEYGYSLQDDPEWARCSARISSLATDVTELIAELGFRPSPEPRGTIVAYHAACSLEHGQRVTDVPVALLRAAGFKVRIVPEGHICCGSAGLYSLLEPVTSTRLRDRKISNAVSLAPDVIATGNIGCLVQLAGATDIPVVHTVELLDWASGGPKPAVMKSP